MIITFLPVPPLGCEKNPCLSNPIPYPEYLYLSVRSFLVILTAPTKQFSSVGSNFKIYTYVIKNVNVYLFFHDHI